MAGLEWWLVSVASLSMTGNYGPLFDRTLLAGLIDLSGTSFFVKPNAFGTPPPPGVSYSAGNTKVTLVATGRPCGLGSLLSNIYIQTTRELLCGRETLDSPDGTLAMVNVGELTEYCISNCRLITPKPDSGMLPLDTCNTNVQPGAMCKCPTSCAAPSTCQDGVCGEALPVPTGSNMDLYSQLLHEDLQYTLDDLAKPVQSATFS